MSKERYNRDKFKNLIHYVIWKAGARAGFGATKLYKVAWFADARSFLLTGKSITGAPYTRQKYGPVPRDGWHIRTELVNEGAIDQWKDREYDHPSWRFRAKLPPNISGFSLEELATIDYWIKHIDEEHTATSISEESHDYGWEIAPQGASLPFHAFVASRIRHELTDDERKRLEAKAKELGLI